MGYNIPLLCCHIDEKPGGCCRQQKRRSVFMLVICEDCAKKYSIDEKRITSSKVKFRCRACGHIIVVEKPQSKAGNPSEEASGKSSAKSPQSTEQESPAQEAGTSKEQGRTKESGDKSADKHSHAVRVALRRSLAARKGPRFFIYLLAVMLFGFLMISTIFIHFYLNTIPNILRHELELRSQAFTESLQEAIIHPLSRGDYLTVNQEVQRVSQLPGVAYAAVRNTKGIIVAGFFDNLNHSAGNFSRKIKKREFQAEILAKNTISPGKAERRAVIKIGAVSVYDRAAALPDVGGDVHLGLTVESLDTFFFKALLSPLTLTLLFLLLLSGYLLFLLLDKLITQPMQALTDTANRISLGELDIAVRAAGPREIRELGAALERMRHSIKVATERLSEKRIH
ncbi:MAG: HAMP domain-containing protein [Candidatus Electrothrix sp. EH2]|nr:HAMP domain-containing protein [Candidatus Electrothrix sp. EH2]